MEAATSLIPPELAGTVHLGWTPEPPRQIPLPPAIGAMLGGGLQRGRLCEITGKRGSGRTSLIYTFLAAATAADEVAAIVDAADSFDPASAARAAIDLGSLLWVRPPSARDALRCAEMILGAGGFGLVVLDLDGVPLRRLRLYTWPRLARAAEKSGAALVLLAPERMAGSFAAFSVKLERTRSIFSKSSRFQVPGSKFGKESFRSPNLEPGTWNLEPSLFDGLESYGILAHNKRGPLRASPRIRWTVDPTASDPPSETQNSKLKTKNSRAQRA